MKRLGKAVNEEETDIDITPMLDVVFIMLIFFIVTASFVKESGIGINNPPENNEPPPLDAPVTDLNEIKIQDRIVDARAVKPTITRLKAESPESSVVVKVDPKAKTKSIIEAMDGIRAANVLLPSVTMSSG